MSKIILKEEKKRVKLCCYKGSSFVNIFSLLDIATKRRSNFDALVWIIVNGSAVKSRTRSLAAWTVMLCSFTPTFVARHETDLDT